MLVTVPGCSVVILQNMQSRVSKPQPAGGLHMVLFKAAHEKQRKLLEVFILSQGKSLEFLGTLHLSSSSLAAPQSLLFAVLGQEGGDRSALVPWARSGPLCRCWSAPRQHVLPEQDCHSIFCAIPV